jgi:hypothetical protein
MRSGLHGKVVAALLAPALIASGAAQGTLLMRCGPEARMSCCRPAGEAPPPSSTIAPGTPQCCAMSAPGTPARATHDPASTTTAPAPMLIAVAAEVVRLDAASDPVRHAPRLDPPPGLSPLLANCALLI